MLTVKNCYTFCQKWLHFWSNKVIFLATNGKILFKKIYIFGYKMVLFLANKWFYFLVKKWLRFGKKWLYVLLNKWLMFSKKW